VGLVNREDDTEDRAVVRIKASLRAYVEDGGGRHILQKGAKSENVRLCEYWTLARSSSAEEGSGNRSPLSSPARVGVIVSGPFETHWRTFFRSRTVGVQPCG
jgi:hypothetical protein